MCDSQKQAQSLDHANSYDTALLAAGSSTAPSWRPDPLPFLRCWPP